MRVAEWTSGLVWVALAAGAVVLAARSMAGGEAVDPPGHEASSCPPCRTSGPSKARPLPFEIDGLNVRVEPPGTP